MKFITEAQIDAALQKHNITIISLWAPWCQECKWNEIQLEQILKHFNVGSYLAHWDRSQHLKAQYSLVGLPTTLFFFRGQMKRKKIGRLSLEEIVEQIEQLKHDNLEQR